MPRLRLIGPGRAGSALQRALERRGWVAADPVRRGESPRAAAMGVDMLVVSVPDESIASVASAVEPVESTVVVHLAGSIGLEALVPHLRRAAIHPLVAMPSAEVGARRLSDGAWFAVAGDPFGLEVVTQLGGRAFEVADDARPLYHAAAVIASNHLVALLGQAERVAAAAGVPFEAYLDLVRATVDNVAELGPAAALTGPAARDDRLTIQRHLDALPDDEREAYEVLVRLARRLVE